MQNAHMPAPQHNPYDFITNAPTKPKKSLLPGGNSRTSRLILAGAGGLLILLIALVVISLLNSGSTALKADYTSLLQQQTELIRISSLGSSKARVADTKNLAITTQLTLASQQNSLLSSAKDAGARTDAKSLALGKNTKTDETLTSAEQANQFDDEFTKILIEELHSYQAQLRKIYDATGSGTDKDTLSRAFNAIDDLLGSADTASP